MATIKEFGSFYLGGRTVKVPLQGPNTYDVIENYKPDFLQHDLDYVIEQFYVQYFIPEKQTSDIPVVLVHGGGQTGAGWENTPDGRPGWLHFLLDAGYTCYVMDNIERGRSGWCPFENIWPGKAELRSAQENWDLFRIGAAKNFADKIPFEHQQFPTDYFQQLLAYTVPRWRCNSDISVKAIKTLIEKIGTCYLFGHSQSGILVTNAFFQIPELVAHLIVLEPSHLPNIDALKSAQVNHKQITFVYGDFITQHPFWEKSYHQASQLMNNFKQQGANVNFIDLPKRGIIGNSHMLHMDRNNKEVLQVILDLLT